MADDQVGQGFVVALEHADNDPQLLEEMLAMFTQDWPVRLDAVRTAVAAMDPARLLDAAHMAKGLLRTFGATEPATAAEQLELQARAGQVMAAEGPLAALEREAEALLAAIPMWLAILDGRVPAPSGLTLTDR